MPEVGTKFCFHLRLDHSKISSSAFAFFFVLDVYITEVVVCDRQVAVRLRRWLSGQSSHWACSTERGLKSGSPEAAYGECNSTSLPSKRSYCEWEMATEDPDAHW